MIRRVGFSTTWFFGGFLIASSWVGSLSVAEALTATACIVALCGFVTAIILDDRP